MMATRRTTLCEGEEGQRLLTPTTVMGGEEEGDDGTFMSLSPDGADSGIGVDLDGVGGRSIEGGTTGASDNDEDSFSCDCVCSCCCKCREVAGGTSIPSPVITFLSQQYTRLPSIQPPTPLVELQPTFEPVNERLSSVPAAKSGPRSRSTTRLDDVVMAAVKRHDDNTMAAIVRRRRRLKLRAKSGEYQSVPFAVPESSTVTSSSVQQHNLDTAVAATKQQPSRSGDGSSVTSNNATLMPPTSTHGVRTLEIKFVW